MQKSIYLLRRLVVVLSLFALSSCAWGNQADQTVAPTKMSLEEEMAEEERAAELIATARMEKTQVAAEVSPYVTVSNGEQTYLAFWLQWNDENILLPINKMGGSNPGLVPCKLDPGAEIASGRLISGVAISQNECVLDPTALENAPPIIGVQGRMDGIIELEAIHVIDLKGASAENLAQVVTFVIENDLLGSGDLTVSVYPTDGPNENDGDASSVPSYVLTADALQNPFEEEEIADFEVVADVVYALRRRFTWEIPPGYEALSLSAGDENWFAIKFRESDGETGTRYLQVKGVGTP